MNKIQKIVERFSPAKTENIKFFNYSVTNLCNSKCTTCNIWQLYRPGQYNLGTDVFLSEIKPEDLRKGFQDTKSFNSLRNINLTGGEPFLKKDFVQIVQTLNEIFPNIVFSITSNGLETDYTLKRLKELRKLDIHPNVTFSVDGIQKEHDRVRGVEGGFEKTLSTVKLVKKELPELNMAISFTINPTNYKELSKVFNMTKELEIGLITRFALINPGFYFNANMEIKWTKQALDETKKELMNIKDEKYKKANPAIALISAEKFFFNNMTKQVELPKRNYNCFSGTHGFFMDPYGNINSCFILEQKFGNIKKQKFDELWYSKEAQKAREFISARKCNCWTECDTIPSLEKNNAMVIKDNLADALGL